MKELANVMVGSSSTEAAQAQIQSWLPESKDHSTLVLISAILFMLEDNVKEAVRALRAPRTMEHHALLVQLYLRMDRLDLAQKELKALKAKDEDSCLTSLATAWTHMCTGDTKLQEAAYIYDELVDKYGASATLLNGLAVAKMHQGAFEEAEGHLQEALTKVT